MMQLDNLAGDVQPQSEPGAVLIGVRLVELIEDALASVLRNTDAEVADRQPDSAVAIASDSDIDRSAVRLEVWQRGT